MIKICIEKNIGAQIKQHNVSTIGYCDDVLLLGHLLKDVQSLVKICEEYGRKWRISFNEKKSNILTIGQTNFNIKDYNIKLNGKCIPYATKIKYLGIEINETLNFNEFCINRFKKVQKAFFNLGNIGLKYNGIHPFQMAFIYNSMCQSKGLYAIELLNTNNKTQDALNLVQNFLIRYAMGLCKFNRIFYILKILKIFDIKKNYIYKNN